MFAVVIATVLVLAGMAFCGVDGYDPPSVSIQFSNTAGAPSAGQLFVQVGYLNVDASSNWVDFSSIHTQSFGDGSLEIGFVSLYSCTADAFGVQSVSVTYSNPDLAGYACTMDEAFKSADAKRSGVDDQEICFYESEYGNTNTFYVENDANTGYQCAKVTLNAKMCYVHRDNRVSNCIPHCVAPTQSVTDGAVGYHSHEHEMVAESAYEHARDYDYFYGKHAWSVLSMENPVFLSGISLGFVACIVLVGVVAAVLCCNQCLFLRIGGLAAVANANETYATRKYAFGSVAEKDEETGQMN